MNEINPSNPQAPIKDGYIKKSVAIHNIERHPVNFKILYCTANYYDYAINKSGNPIFSARGLNPIDAYHNLLKLIENKIFDIIINNFRTQYEASKVDKNEHYITFWNQTKAEYIEYEEIRKIIETEINKLKVNPIV